jgi:hypothetical protein
MSTHHIPTGFTLHNLRNEVHEHEHVVAGSSQLQSLHQYSCTPLSDCSDQSFCFLIQTAVFIKPHI